MPLTKSGRAALAAIIPQILAEPRKINMARWATKLHFVTDIPPCNTVGCIAGWIVANTLEKPEDLYRLLDNDSHYLTTPGECASDGYHLIGIQAARILGYQRVEEIAGLFTTGSWPAKYRLEIAKYRFGTPEYARVVADRIQNFIDETPAIDD